MNETQKQKNERRLRRLRNAANSLTQDQLELISWFFGIPCEDKNSIRIMLLGDDNPAIDPACQCDYCGCVHSPKEGCIVDYSPDESMDGDAASALASAGFGVDEDYEHNSYDDIEY